MVEEHEDELERQRCHDARGTVGPYQHHGQDHVAMLQRPEPQMLGPPVGVEVQRANVVQQVVWHRVAQRHLPLGAVCQQQVHDGLASRARVAASGGDRERRACLRVGGVQRRAHVEQQTHDGDAAGLARQHQRRVAALVLKAERVRARRSVSAERRLGRRI